MVVFHAVSRRHHESFLRTVIAVAYFSRQLRNVAISSIRSGSHKASIRAITRAATSGTPSIASR